MLISKISIFGDITSPTRSFFELCVWVHTAGCHIGNSLNWGKDSSQWQRGVKDLPALSVSDLSKGYCRAAVRDLNMMSHSHSPAAVLGRENWGIYNTAKGKKTY